MNYNISNILKNHGYNRGTIEKSKYFNLYKSIKNAIISKTLSDNFKLPPTRVLAKDLELSRSTVLKAYELLLLEKYIKSKPGSGYFITSSKAKKIKHRLYNQLDKGNYPIISRRGNSFRQNLQIINNESEKGIAFRPGLPPLDIFPVSQWKSLTNNYWKNVKPSQLSYSNTVGLKSLRKNIRDYLKINRNINCSLDQIIITTGSLHSLSLIGEVLINPKDEVVIENPTYPHAFNLFSSLKAQIIKANLDSQGISIKSIKTSKPKLVYTTPSNQYPTGIKMSLERRIEILKWASKKNTLIIEDDYNHEFSNWQNPISAIRSIDNQDRVVYLGTFNKLLHPSVRLGYMIVPKYLIDTVISLYEQSSRFVSPSQQQVLSDFIEKDFLNKHLRNVLEVSKERKEIFSNTFNDLFENKISLKLNNSGLHIIGFLDNSIEDKKLAKYLKRRNIIAHALSDYYMGSNAQNGLVMGYCSVNNKTIKETIVKMKGAYDDYRSLS